MKISTTQQPKDFLIHKNKLFTNDFYSTQKHKINIDLSRFIDLDLFNSILKTLHIIKFQEEISPETYKKHQRIFKNWKSISEVTFNKHFILFKLFHAVVTNKPLDINNLSELAYSKMFQYSIGHNKKQINFIPNLELNVLTIDKYSYIYNHKVDKKVKKEIKELLKNQDFIGSLNTHDKIFFNFFFKSKFMIGKIKNAQSIQNEFLLQGELYIIYQEYLILLNVLKNKNKNTEEKEKVMKLFFSEHMMEVDINKVIQIIPELEEKLFTDIYNHIYKFFNFEDISSFKNTSSRQYIFEGFKDINKTHKQYLLEKCKK